MWFPTNTHRCFPGCTPTPLSASSARALAYLAELVCQAVVVAPSLTREVLAQHELAVHVKLVPNAPQRLREALVPDAYLRASAARRGNLSALERGLPLQHEPLPMHVKRPREALVSDAYLRAPVARRGNLSALERGLPLQHEPLPVHAKVARDTPQRPHQAYSTRIRMRPSGAFAPLHGAEVYLRTHIEHSLAPQYQPRPMHSKLACTTRHCACARRSYPPRTCTYRALPATYHESLPANVKITHEVVWRLRARGARTVYRLFALIGVQTKWAM
ncbi:hypothetical protein B0H11DRAFT_2243393 [Mycena galericulata]|nr:hypothetical protein B0H11DRAFT_2243393 [Mycena galericulata]